MLTASGVLQRCLPELDDALARDRRRRSSSTRSRRCGFPRLSARARAARARGRPAVRERACCSRALALDACDDDVVAARSSSPAAPCSGSTSAPASSSRSPASSATPTCSTAAARRTDALSEESVLQIAVHLGQHRAGRRALPPVARGRPTQSAQDAERLARAARARARRAGAPRARRPRGGQRGRAPPGRSRAIRDAGCGEGTHPTAPRAYVLAQAPVDLARQAALCEPTPRRATRSRRVSATADAHPLEVAARDRVGLLAHDPCLVEADCSIDRRRPRRGATAPRWRRIAYARPISRRRGSSCATLGRVARRSRSSRAPVPDVISSSTTRAHRGTRVHRDRAATGPGLLHALTARSPRPA